MTKNVSYLFIFLVFYFLTFHSIAAETLTWQDCVSEAARNHPDLISQQEAVKESETDKKIAQAPIFPQVNSDISVSTAKTGSTVNSFTYGLSGTQLLFDGQKTVNNINAASENIKAAQYNYKFTSSQVRLRLRTAFINLLKAQGLLNITQEIFNIRRGNLELITLRYESGIEHKGALLTAEANLMQAQFEISQAKRQLEVSQRQLIKEMGRFEFSPIQAKGSFEVSSLLSEKPDFGILSKNNPSLQRFSAQRMAALFDIKAQTADFFPRFSTEASADKTGFHWPPEDERWNVGVSLSLPLFEGGLRQAEVFKARHRFNQAHADERSARDGIILTLQRTWVALQDAVETVAVQNKFLDAAGERSKIAESQYSLGLIQFDNWIIIQDELVRVKKAFLDVQANALLAEADWIQAKGEMLEYAQ